MAFYCKKKKNKPPQRDIYFWKDSSFISGLASKEYILAAFLKHFLSYLSPSQTNQTKKEKSLTTAEMMSTRITGSCNLFYANFIRKTFPCLPLPPISYLPSGKPSSYHSENTVKLFPPKSLQPKIKKESIQGEKKRTKGTIDCFTALTEVDPPLMPYVSGFVTF